MSRIDKIKIQLRSIEMLRILKHRYTYETLSKMTEIPITVLNRYVKGRVIPGEDKARHIISLLDDHFNIEEEIRNKIILTENNIVDSSQVLSDTVLTRRIAEKAIEMFSDKKIDVVLTAAVDGIPIASQIANLLEVKLAIAKKYKNLTSSNYVSTVFLSGDVSVSLYVPKGLIKKKYNVLVVDDLIMGGSTQRALLDLVKNCKANTAGVFCLAALGDLGLNRIKDFSDSPIQVMLHLEERE